MSEWYEKEFDKLFANPPKGDGGNTTATEVRRIQDLHDLQIHNTQKQMYMEMQIQASPVLSPLLSQTPQVPPMSDSQDYTRFRSFAERYIVERASTFRVGHEQEDSWRAEQDARSIYDRIDNQATRAYRQEVRGARGATGPKGSPYYNVFGGVGKLQIGDKIQVRMPPKRK